MSKPPATSSEPRDPAAATRRPGFLMHRARMLATRSGAPFLATLEITERCNLRCRHCYIQHPPAAKDLSLAEWQGVLDQLADEGTLFLTFSGGEPLLREDFLRIAAYARKRDFSFVLFTNGNLVTPNIADRLQALQAQRVEISILGARAETHDAITATRGSFRHAVRAVELLVERGVKVQIKTTWMRTNIAEEEPIKSLARRLGATFRAGFLVLPQRGRDGGTERIEVTTRQLQAMAGRSFNRQHAKADTSPPPRLSDAQKHDLSPCGAGQSTCCIDASGNVSPCVALDVNLGNLRDTPFKEIWSRSETLREIRKIRVDGLTECSSCELFLRCNRCTGLAAMETGSLLGPSRQACKVTRAFEAFRRQKTCEFQ